MIALPRWACYYADESGQPLAQYTRTADEALALSAGLPAPKVYDRRDGLVDQLIAAGNRERAAALLTAWADVPMGRLTELVQLLDHLHPARLIAAVATEHLSPCPKHPSNRLWGHMDCDCGATGACARRFGHER